MNIKVDDRLIAKIQHETDYFDDLINGAEDLFKKTNDLHQREQIARMIGTHRYEKNEFLRSLAIIGFPGVSNVNGMYEFSEDEAFDSIDD